MNRKAVGGASIAVLVLTAACLQAPTSVDPEAERRALLAVYEQAKRAHLETNPELLLEHAGETFIAVSNGQVLRQTLADVAAFFNAYFRAATYQEYADLEPPIVRVSDDGSMEGSTRAVCPANVNSSTPAS